MRKSNQEISCLFCKGNAEFSMPPIWENIHWRVEHARNTEILGWLIVILKRHCSSLHDLTADEWQSAGNILSDVCTAMKHVMQAEKEYILQLGEGEDCNHVHFHVVARLLESPDRLKGRKVLNAFGPQVRQRVALSEVALLSLKLQDFLKRYHATGGANNEIRNSW